MILAQICLIEAHAKSSAASTVSGRMNDNFGETSDFRKRFISGRRVVDL
jgi:hypothetical protein